MAGRKAIDVEAVRRARELRRQVAKALQDQRRDAGLTASAVARGAHLSASTVGRIEAGSMEPSLESMVRMASVLGCEVSVRLFPSGLALRDRFQAPMLEALLGFVHPSWRRWVEVPVAGVTPGVIDCVLGHPTRPLLVAVEVHSELRRVDAIIRRSIDTSEALRNTSIAASVLAADGTDRLTTSRLLVVRSTAVARETVSELARTFAAAFPARVADALAALRAPAEPWPGAALIWADLHGRAVSIRRLPPRGVEVGR